jgi:Zn-dependent protease with chaperone function
MVSEFSGTYFDGKCSKPFPVTIVCAGDRILIRANAGELPAISVPLKDCKFTPPLGKSRRSMMLPDGARCDSVDLEAVAALEARFGANRGLRFVWGLESRWRLVAGSLAVLLSCVWACIVYGIPFLAEKAAAAIPQEVVNAVSRNTMDLLENRFLQPSTLEPHRRNEIQALFQSLAGKNQIPHGCRLELRSSPRIGANAFALPSGIVLVTDELVQLAKNDQELIGVFLHEIAHIERRHGIRMLLQDAGVFLLLSALMGDVASISSVAGALPVLFIDSGYSRQFEREADRAAGLYMLQQGWGTRPFQDMLHRLRLNEPPEVSGGIFSSHPETEERLAYLREMDRNYKTGSHSRKAAETG